MLDVSESWAFLTKRGSAQPLSKNTWKMWVKTKIMQSLGYQAKTQNLVRGEGVGLVALLIWRGTFLGAEA